MNLINKKVRHKSFGEGIITKKVDDYITVLFDKSEKKFVYPSVFDGYLTIDNIEINNEIKRELKRIKELDKIRLAEKEYQMNTKKILEEKKHKRGNKDYPRENIAFKCNYCDGGMSNSQVGFNGICSDKIIKNNIEIEKRIWCTSEKSLCLKYVKGNLTRLELENTCNKGDLVCYESQMLRDWKALAGIVQRGERKGKPMKLNKVQNNSLCVLTTREPDSTERDRYIFAIFLIDETHEGDNQEEGYVSTKSKYRIKLSPAEARKMLFWNYHANENQPEVALWSSGLHRYFEDEQAIEILKDIAELKEGTEEEELAKEFLFHFAKINGVNISNESNKNGALMR